MVGTRDVGKLLLDKGFVNKEQLEAGIKESSRTGVGLTYALTKLGYIDEDKVTRFIGAQLGIPYVNLDETEPKPSALEVISGEYAQKNLILPLNKKDEMIELAMVDPLNLQIIEEIKVSKGYNVKPFIAPEGRLRIAIEKYYFSISKGRRLEVKPISMDVSKWLREHSDSSLIELVNHIIQEAVRTGASDIHFEPYEDTFRIRYRLDGVLYEVAAPPKQLHAAMLSRIKVMSNLDIAERRLPQDGRAKLRVENKDVDLRVSTIATVFGEKASLRILDSASLCLELEELGFDPKVLSTYEELIRVPYGMILVTGPTGSGKSTTLYSTLKILNQPDKNIITIEDPVEYILPGVNQVQVKPEIGLDFASGLRSFLRQDPDIIMVGEIRDRETAEVAINAALTGHLVLSTLHTNDAPGAITRLVNMGIEPFLITSTVVMSIAQRLVRKICPYCKEAYQVEKELAKKTLAGLKDIQTDKLTLYRGKGCDKCYGIGYKGRTGIFELMVMTDRIKALVLDREPTHIIKEAAEKEGMINLRQAALAKVIEGITTVEELLRVTFEEEIVYKSQ